MEKRIQPPKLVQLTKEQGAYCDPVTGECFPPNLQVSPQPLEKEVPLSGSASDITLKKQVD
jgi:hypothetical protein